MSKLELKMIADFEIPDEIIEKEKKVTENMLPKKSRNVYRHE